MKTQQHMQDLFRKYLENQCSPEEVKELLEYFKVPGNEILLRGLIIENLENIDADDDGTRWHPAMDEMFAVIKKQLDTEKGKQVFILRRTWFRVAAAAVLVVGAFAGYNFIKNANQKQDIETADASKQDVSPGYNKAILTLADGSTIVLENAGNGTLTQQGDTKILKPAHGQLAYKSLNEKPTEVLFNSIATPRGGQYQLTLSDGTKVWLNAASSLRFPANFGGIERKVELTGEAYFEVAKNASIPFKVEIAGKGEVEVLGTHFNLNAYSDEETVSTTLLEGRVKLTVRATRDSRIINAGEEVEVNGNGEISINKNADTEQAMGWKNGTFNFTNAELSKVLRQLSRWYDVDIVFEGPVPQRKFNGEIQRDLKLTQVLRLLEKNNVSCRIEGKSLIVQQ